MDCIMIRPKGSLVSMKALRALAIVAGIAVAGGNDPAGGIGAG